MTVISSLMSVKISFHLLDICWHSVAGLLACGDDRGALWLYSLKEVLQKKRHKTEVQPTAILDWPDVTDLNLDRNRKLRLGVYDIVVDSVAVSCTGRYLVAVTNNNMVCIWKRTRSWNKQIPYVACLVFTVSVVYTFYSSMQKCHFFPHAPLHHT
jgi:hypothetical protein